MDKLKQYVLMTVVGALAILLLGYNFFVSPKKAEANDLRTQAETQVSANAQLRTKLTVLRAQAKELPKQQAKLAAVAARIPDSPALPSLIRALTTASTAAGIELVSVAPGASTAVTATVGAPVAPVGAGAVPAPTAAAVGATASGTLAAIPLVINVVGSYFQLEQFLSNLENLPRSLRTGILTLAPGLSPVSSSKSASVDDGRTLTGTVTAQVFMASNRPAAIAVTVPGAPAPTTVAGPAATPKK